MKESTERQQREAAFHEQWAASVRPEEIEVDAFFESPTALENRFILSQMGPLRGKKLLDIGCGLGDSAVYFAKQGAVVTGLDLSQGMIDAMGELARLHQVTVAGVVSEAEKLNVPDRAFDFIYAANLLHHVPSKPSLFQEMARVLKPGGRFFVWDPLAYNPAINIYRRIANRVRTDEESPLRSSDVALMQQYFRGVQTRTFWIDRRRAATAACRHQGFPASIVRPPATHPPASWHRPALLRAAPRPRAARTATPTSRARRKAAPSSQPWSALSSRAIIAWFSSVHA
jgi:SAM-dependent methyltransferase